MLWGRKHTKKLSRVHTAHSSNVEKCCRNFCVQVHTGGRVYTLYKLKYKMV